MFFAAFVICCGACLLCPAVTQDPRDEPVWRQLLRRLVKHEDSDVSRLAMKALVDSGLSEDGILQLLTR